MQRDLDAEEPLHKCVFPGGTFLHFYRDHAGKAARPTAFNDGLTLFISVLLTLKISSN